MVRFSVGKLALAAADGRTRWWGPHQLHKGEVPYLQLLPLGQAQVCVCVCLCMHAHACLCVHLCLCVRICGMYLGVYM